MSYWKKNKCNKNILKYQILLKIYIYINTILHKNIAFVDLKYAFIYIFIHQIQLQSYSIQSYLNEYIRAQDIYIIIIANYLEMFFF